MKVLVIGGGGQLGSNLLELLKNTTDVYATYMIRKPKLHPSRIFQVDKTKHQDVISLIQRLKPDTVIDTAALHSVDYCEKNQKEAWTINVEGTRNIVKACKETQAKMVFISTDYVFDGSKGNYTEEDTPNPINYYGQTKLEAEKMIADTYENHLIARTSVIYSWIPPDQRLLQSSSGKSLNFAMWLVQKLNDGTPVTIVDDQYSSPTLANNLAEALLKLSNTHRNGIYHIAGKTRLNRYDFAIAIAQQLDFDSNLISPITTKQLGLVAKRPMDSSLNVEKVEQHLKYKMLSIADAMHVFQQAGVEP